MMLLKPNKTRPCQKIKTFNVHELSFQNHLFCLHQRTSHAIETTEFGSQEGWGYLAIPGHTCGHGYENEYFRNGQSKNSFQLSKIGDYSVCVTPNTRPRKGIFWPKGDYCIVKNDNYCPNNFYTETVDGVLVLCCRHDHDDSEDAKVGIPLRMRPLKISFVGHRWDHNTTKNFIHKYDCDKMQSGWVFEKSEPIKDNWVSCLYKRKDYDEIVASLEQPIFGRDGLKSEESIDTAVLDFDETDSERVEGSG